MLTLLAATILGFPQAIQAGDPQADPKRPRDIWVFRSVLDQHPRMVNILLSDDLVAAYDTGTAGLYRAWSGTIKLEGAVYNIVHGPQPTSRGSLFWVDNKLDRPHWFIKRGNKTEWVTPRYVGYRFRNGGVTLDWELPGERNRPIRIEETPERFATRTGLVGFERRFRTSNVPSTLQVGFRMSYLDPGRAGLGTDAVMTDLAPPNPEGLSSAKVILRNNGTTVLRLTYPKPPSPKPQPSAENQAQPKEPTQDTATEREPGVSVRLYEIGASLDRIPRLIDGQTPNISTISPNVNFNGFPISSRFLVRVSGFLNVQIPGEYTLRLASDDGSRLSVKGKVIIDHDGLHSANPPQGLKTGTVTLEAGETPFLIEYFQNEGDAVLRLDWRVPGTNFFDVIPAQHFTTAKGEVRVTSPGLKRVEGITPTRPGDRSPLDSHHPSYSLSTIRPPWFQPRVGGLAFADNDRLLVCTWDPDGAVYEVRGWNLAPDRISVRRIAAGLAEPLGIRVVNGRIFVLQKQELTELVDGNQDGIIDEYRSIANSWGVTANFHEFAFGLEWHQNAFWAALAIAINPGGRSTIDQNQDRGHVIRIGLDGKVEKVASGLRTPNGIGFGAGGRLYVTDNQGDWLPSSKLLEVIPGAFYGSRSVNQTPQATEQPPVVWLPQGEVGNSPSQPAPLNDGPYKGQMVIGDVTYGGLQRVFVEEIEGQRQGSVFRMTQGLEAGVNRLIVAPDGSLIIGGIGSSGNWGQAGKASFGLQRLKFNGKVTFEMLAIRAFSNGIEIEFTEPLAEGSGDDPAFYNVRQWRYEPTADYGGPKKNEVELPISSLSLSQDRRRAFLALEQMSEGSVLAVRLHPSVTGQGGQTAWTTEGWYTLNRIPKNRPGTLAIAPTQQPNALTAEERRDGFTLLFDGQSLAGWRGFRQQEAPLAWAVENGTLAFTPGRPGGDLVTEAQYENFELRLQWRISRGGNSGIMFRAFEDLNFPWETGPEMQVLDNEGHPDGKSPLTSAGALYGLIAPPRDVTRPVASWNDVRIIAKGQKVQFFLNGVLTADFDMGSAAWQKLVEESKFASMPAFGKLPRGHIVLQDHGDRVNYRSIRIRRL
jgi:cytochrome c